MGLAATVTADDLELTIDRARLLLDATGPDPDALLETEAVEASGAAAPSDRWTRWAACALSTAAWDLRARRNGRRCADLWSDAPVPDDLDCYASGLFLGTSLTELSLQAQRYRSEGYSKVKMRTGGTVDSDLQRLGAVRSAFPEPGTIAVDSVNCWGVDAARSFIGRAGDLLWVEDPVPLKLIHHLVDVSTMVAAGESRTTLADLEALYRTGAVPAMLLDVQQLGGPERFLDAARRLASSGARNRRARLHERVDAPARKHPGSAAAGSLRLVRSAPRAAGATATRRPGIRRGPRPGRGPRSGCVGSGGEADTSN